MLRTPSSFLSKRGSGSDYPRTMSVDETESQSLPVTTDDPVVEQGNNNHDSEVFHSNGHNSNGVENGNHKIEAPDGPQLSTSDRRKAFEARSISTSSVPDNVNSRKPRVTVADRLKMFQHNSPNEEEEQKPQPPISLERESHSDSKVESKVRSENVTVSTQPLEGPNPIPKPERKSLQRSESNAGPPKSQEVHQLAAPVKTNTKRIDTVFG